METEEPQDPDGGPGIPPGTVEDAHRLLIESFSVVLLTGRAETVLASFEFPSAFYLEEALVPCRTPDDLLPMLLAYQSALRENDVEAIETAVALVSSARDGRYVYAVEKTYLAADRAIVGRAEGRYFVSTATGAPRIQMMEYTSLPFRDRLVG